MDAIFFNCTVHTLADPPTAEAFHVAGDRISAVGSKDDLLAARGPTTEVVDLEGRFVVPGFTDAHTHLLEYGLSRHGAADLRGCESIAEMVERMRRHAQQIGIEPDRPHAGNFPPWVLGYSFDHEKLQERRFPTRHDLDRVSAHLPVVAVRLCMHALAANSAAIELVRNRLGVEQVRTGVLVEDAMAAIWEVVPEPSPVEIRAAAKWAAEDAASKGITSVHVVVHSPEQLNALRDLNAAGELAARLYLMLSPDMARAAAERGERTGSGDDMLRIGPVKFFADGAMGARTAAMIEPYADDPGNSGVLLMDEDQLVEQIRHFSELGFQTVTHAIGDRAVTTAVMAIARALDDTNDPLNTRRHRIEHGAVLTEAALETLARRRIPVVASPQFVTTDSWTIKRVGPERMKLTYCFKTMLDHCVPLAFGSDAPVEELDPIALIRDAVVSDEHTRQERLTAEEALRTYCLGGTHAELRDKDKGSMGPGKLADFAVFDEDPLAVNEGTAGGDAPFQVYVGGRMARRSRGVD